MNLGYSRFSKKSALYKTSVSAVEREECAFVEKFVPLSSV
jgi:hypothetical protein